MRYKAIPGQPDAVIWFDDSGNSGVTRDADAEAWARFQEWLAQGNALQVDGASHTNDIEGARELANARLLAAADVAMSPIIARYPAVEVASWPAQSAEAEAWTADNTAATPFIDSMCSETEKAELCATIIAKGLAYKQSCGQVIAWRRAVSAWIESCPDAAALATYRPNFPEVPA